MTIAQKGLSASLTSKDQNTAFNLAQDAVEYVRFARDTNCLASGPGGCPATGATNWLKNTVDLTPCVSVDITQPGSAACYLDSYANTVTACASGVCATPINYDSTNNDYTYGSSGTTPTMFTRTVQIQNNPGCTTTCNAAEADVVVTVSWSDPAPHSISVRESLYDWQ